MRLKIGIFETHRMKICGAFCLMVRPVIVAFILVSSSAIAGCLQGASEFGSPMGDAIVNADRPVVVAILDSGINPYHNVFRLLPSSAESMEAFKSAIWDHSTGREATSLSLTLGEDYDSSFTADEDLWQSLSPRVLYSFEGTNILAISFYDRPDNNEFILDDALWHGTATSSIVVQTVPNVIVVMVEFSLSMCAAYREPCLMDPKMVEAIEWVAAQPWIDIVSLSFGPYVNHPAPEADEFAKATRRAVADGKLVFTANGNEIVPGTLSGINGPPWVIAVGGVTQEQNGETVLSSKIPDVVANWSARVAAHESVGEYYRSIGTSVAAPRVAGVLARALGELRAGAGESDVLPDGYLVEIHDGRRVDNMELWRALNVSARHDWQSDYDPSSSLSGSWNDILSTSAPILTPAPYVQMGWGFVDNSTVDAMVARILANDLGIPPEKADAAAYMERVHAARQAYWSARFDGSGS